MQKSPRRAKTMAGCWLAIALFVCLFSSQRGHASTNVSGAIITSTWTLANSPYVVVGNVNVAGLTIQPGVQVIFQSNYVFEVDGNISAVGTAAAPIVFMGTNGGWQGIYFNFANPGSVLDYCVISNSVNSGIVISNTNPEIANCVIANNRAPVNGGGIKARNSTGADLILQNCIISNNVVGGVSDGSRGGDVGNGGGVSAQLAGGALIMDGCLVSGNVVNPQEKNFGSYAGGGVYVSAGSCSLSNCVISNNLCYSVNYCGNGETASGGGVCSALGATVLKNCIVSGNSVITDTGECPGKAYGGGIYALQGSLSIANSIVGGNTAASPTLQQGGGLYLSSQLGTASIVNCTIAYNSIEGLWSGLGAAQVMNSILFFNNSSGTQISGVTNVTNVTYCDVQGGFTGLGNIDFNPTFQSTTNLIILPGSLCIDAGNPSPAYDDSCVPPSLGTFVNDIGAYGGPGACGWNAPVLPLSISITNPANGAIFAVPAIIPIDASVTDLNGGASVTNVTFFNGATQIGQVTSAPFSCSWTNPPLGMYVLAAVATDNSGMTATSSTVTGRVTGQPLNVGIASPSNGAAFPVGYNISITATNGDPNTNGIITNFFILGDTNMLGVSMNSPLSVVWTNPPFGNRVLKAVAADSYGIFTTSAPVNITVTAQKPVVSITSPTNGAAVAFGASPVITATARDVNSNGSITSVSFYAGTTLLGVSSNSPYMVTWTNPALGAYDVKAVATDNYGLSATATNRVTVSQPALFQFSATNYTVSESNGAVVVAVNNAGGMRGSVQYATCDLTAVGGSGSWGDYTATNGTLDFAGGSQSINITIPILNNYLPGPDIAFQIQLSNPNPGSLGSPSMATVTIHEYGGTTFLPSVFPLPASQVTGQLQVTLVPTNANGQWRFPSDVTWRPSGSVVSNVLAGNYPILFNVKPGYVPVISNLTSSYMVGVTNGLNSIIISNYSTLNSTNATNAGSLTMNIYPNDPAGAGWRFLGETVWHASGFTTNVLPNTYLIEFEPVSGWSWPKNLAVTVPAGMSATNTVNYLLPATPPATALFPSSVPPGGFTNTSLPYAFNGQLESDVGFGSGVAVRETVVLTAAHLVFNDNTLSYVSQVNWFFQEDQTPIVPAVPARGWYVLSGYAARRTNDLAAGYSPGQSTALSQDFDVAALYFNDPVANSGYGGYLGSDDSPDPWLVSTNLKMLAGYPVDGSSFGQMVQPGLIYSTPLSSAPFIQESSEVYATASFLSFPGNSGGPVYVRYTNGFLYPAAVYLGTTGGGLGSMSLMRAIDSNAVNLINLAASKGDYGTNNNGGGVITIIAPADIKTTAGFVQIQLGPPEAVQAGAGWRLQGEPAYSSNPNYVDVVSSPGVEVVQFAPINGWAPPTNQTITVVKGTVISINANYTQTNLNITKFPPAIVQQPASQTVGLGKRAAFSVVATGTAPLHYQWRLNNKPIAKATNAAYTIAAAAAANNGTYTVVVSNSVSNVASLPAILLATNIPAVTIQTPAGNFRANSGSITIKGTAVDKAGVARVVLTNLTDGFWTTASGTTNWTAEVTLTPGTNVIAVYSIDTNDITSVAATRSFIYVVKVPLTLLANGPGGMKGGAGVSNNALLQVGGNYSVTAVAAKNALFEYWARGTVANGSLVPGFTNLTLHFTMMSNLILQANFLTNPFLAAQGAYNGLFAPTNGPRQHTNSGAITFTLLPTGKFSGKLHLGANTPSFTTNFNLAGRAQFNSVLSAKHTLTTVLQLDFDNQSVSGTVSDGNFDALVAGDRAVFSSAHKATNYQGLYTVIIPGVTGASVGPYGTSYGTVKVDDFGNITFGGSLADNTPVNQSSVVSKDGFWPFYVPLYAGNGSLWGWNCFTTNGVILSSTNTSWINATNTSKTALYRSGFTNQEAAIAGSSYTPTNKPLLELTSGIVILEGGNLPVPITNHIIFSTNNTITVTNAAEKTNKLVLTINTKTGTFGGSFANPTNAKRSITVNGVLLQNKTNAQGYFLGTNQSGVIILH